MLFNERSIEEIHDQMFALHERLDQIEVTIERLTRASAPTPDGPPTEAGVQDAGHAAQ